MVNLATMNAESRAGRERDREAVRCRLRSALAELLPQGAVVWVYGSLVREGRFHEESDIDLALESTSCGQIRLSRLVNALSERLDRRVDACRIESTRLAAAIQREGERWTL